MRISLSHAGATSKRPLSQMTLIGRLTAKPELRKAHNGTDYVTYNLAVSPGPVEASRSESHTSFYPVTFFPNSEGHKQKDYLLGLDKG